MGKALLDVLSGRKPERRPIWFMRQAGRYLPEYRKLRAEAGSFLNLCYNPQNACEVTLQPLRRFDLDAAILFSDILVVPHAMGLSLHFADGEGPQLETVSDVRSVEALKFGTASFQYQKVCETVSLVKKGLNDQQALIGFCGAPWTVASYMIEGGSSKRLNAVRIASENPEWFGLLLERLVIESIQYLTMQIEAGAEAVQIFDSWAGDLQGEVLERCVLKPIAAICIALKVKFPDIPIIVFARGVGGRHGDVARATQAAAIGVESGVQLSDVLASLPERVAVQGNLDPAFLTSTWDACRSALRGVVSGVPKGRHIFNLGHGIVPQTAPERIGQIVDEVRCFDR